MLTSLSSPLKHTTAAPLRTQPSVEASLLSPEVLAEMEAHQGSHASEDVDFTAQLLVKQVGSVEV